MTPRPARKADPAAAEPIRPLLLTGRGAGVLAAFVALAALSIATGSLGALALLSAVGVTLLVAPVAAWIRSRHALLPTPVHVLVHAVPATVRVGESCSLEVVVTGARGRPLPPLGLDRPERHWRLTRRLPAALPVTPVVTRARNGRRLPGLVGHLAPGPLGLLPLSPTARQPADGRGDGSPAVWASMAVPSDRRGVLYLPALRAWTHDPFGLFAVAAAATPSLSVVVHPRPISPLPDELPVSGVAPSGGEAIAAAPWWSTGGCGDFTDLRPYVPGDRLHLIDWPALALYDRLLVRRFDPDAGAGVRIVLDDRAGVHRRASFEHLLSALLGVVELTLASGRPVELSTLSGLRFTVGPTPAGFATVLRVVSVIDPRRSETGWTMIPGAGPGDPWQATVLTTSTGAERLPATVRDRARVVVVR